MRAIYILRHAKSSWKQRGLSDFERPLAPRGHRAAPLLGGHLRRSGIRPAVALCSAALRTQQTLELVLAELDERPAVSIEEALYGASAAHLLERLRALEDRHASALLVGHNPGVGLLALGLAAAAGGEAVERMRGKFPTGALAEIELDVPRWRDLPGERVPRVRFTTPRDLTA